jgi:predicted amidohydrolase
MRVTLVQFSPVHGKPSKSWEKAKRLIKEVETDLILFPELAFTGYLFEDRNALREVAEDPNGGKIFGEVLDFALSRRVSIAYGFPLLEEDRIYNAAVLINKNGEHLIYRKVHLFGIEKRLFDRGRDFPVFNLEGVRVGILICYDWAFPEAARTLALKGAQLILHPSNLVLPYAQDAMKIRALENRVFILTAKRIGSESLDKLHLTFTGKSQVVNPRGEVLFRLGGEVGIRTVDIDPAEADNKLLSEGNDLFRDRLPEAYHEICR